jgi:hypothetical protein
VVDCQRLIGDTASVEPSSVNLLASLWYKNRVLFNYQIDMVSMKGSRRKNRAEITMT